MSLDRIKAKFPDGKFRTEHPYYMMDAISDIPGCLEACLSTEMLSMIEKGLSNIHPQRIFTVGCGTSFNACQAAAYTFRTLLGIPSIAFDALDFELDPPPGIDSNALVISISLSGKSLTTCLAQEKAHQAGAMTVSISGDPESRLAKGAALPIIEPYLDEIPLGKTRSYLSTTLLAMLVGISTADSKIKEEFIANAKTTVGFIRENIDKWEQNAKIVAKEWAEKTSRYMLAGFGIHKANADEIGLKLIEVIGESATGFALEEFTHGPNASFHKDLGIFLFQTDHRSLERAVRVAQGAALSESSLVILTDQADADWPEKAHKIEFPSPDQSQHFGLFTTAVAAQFIMYYLAIEKGMNPDINGHDKHPDRGDIFAFYFPPGTH